MRKQYSRLVQLPMLACILLFFSGCLKDKLTKTYKIIYPVYEEKSTVLANIKANKPVAIGKPGKIFLYGNYIFLNEIDKGVHIIDNSNPSSPVNVAFINIPGNLDIAVKGSTLYADFYTDLLAIDISNPLQAKMGKLLPKIFPERQWTNGFRPDTNRVIVGWIEKDTTVTIIERDSPPIGIGWGCINCMFAADANSSGNKSSVPGIAGSMSRFALVNDYLYAVNQSTLNAISVANSSDPVFSSANWVGWNIETVYPFKDKLFIGSSTGMFIFDIGNAANPERRGSFTHARACDPVVADDKYAFVTLRTGSFCDGTSNQLDVVNVEDVYNPRLVKTYGLTNPHGLAKDGNLLFICDGKDGLKVYDVSNVSNLKLLQHIKGMETYDAIAWNKKLLVVTTEGLRQYDYSNLNSIKLLSTIVTNK